jgi:hypothetical protein
MYVRLRSACCALDQQRHWPRSNLDFGHTHDPNQFRSRISVNTLTFRAATMKQAIHLHFLPSASSKDIGNQLVNILFMR